MQFYARTPCFFVLFVIYVSDRQTTRPTTQQPEARAHDVKPKRATIEQAFDKGTHMRLANWKEVTNAAVL